MNPWIIGALGLIIGAIPSVIFYTQLSPLQRKLQQSEKGRERADQAYNEIKAELEQREGEINASHSKIPQLEAHYRSEIENIEQSYMVQLRELQQAQEKIPELEAQIEDMKASQMRVVELENQLAQLRYSSPEDGLSEEERQILQANHQAEIEAILQSHQADIQQLHQDYQGQLQALQEQHLAEQEAWWQNHQAQLQEIEVKYQNELKTLESTYQQQILEVQQEYEQQEQAAIAFPPREDLEAFNLPAEEAEIEQLNALLDLPSTPEEEIVSPLVEVIPSREEEIAELADFIAETEERRDEVEEFADLPMLTETEMTLEAKVLEDPFMEEMEIPLEEMNLPSLEDLPVPDSLEEDIAGLEDFLQETADSSPEMPFESPDLLLDTPEEEILEMDDFFTGEVEKEPESIDMEAMELELPQNFSPEEEIAGLEDFLQETDSFESETSQELKAEFSPTEEEMDFLSSLQQDEFMVDERSLEVESEELPDLGHLATSEQDIFNMLDLDASEEDGPISSANLADSDPFADIFNGSSHEGNGTSPEEMMMMFDFEAEEDEKDKDLHLEALNELVNLNIADSN